MPVCLASANTSFLICWMAIGYLVEATHNWDEGNALLVAEVGRHPHLVCVGLCEFSLVQLRPERGWHLAGIGLD